MSNPTTASDPLMPSSTVGSFSDVMFNGNEKFGPVPHYTSPQDVAADSPG